ncbi:Dual specificity testis-specific protein kinase 1 [Colletotrichum trifolii]|uniref:Dual specificity testis-specific protein kinase 1 n=1 Tax=Colletotrichum trifolii TaxID=5466 RepID=A0A4R8RIT6_COLTR|nr:Dual specificity testis-specific protein kinase 1 [Colletotrichum trifolii]
MTQTSDSSMELPSSAVPPASTSFLRKLFGRTNASAPGPVGPPHTKEPEPDTEPDSDDPQNADLGRRVSRKVVPGLPRVQTFKRQQSERRNNLAPVEPSPAERRALSVDRRAQPSRTASQAQSFPRASAPDLFEKASVEALPAAFVTVNAADEKAESTLEQMVAQAAEPEVEEPHVLDVQSNSDAQSVTTSHSHYEEMIYHELETVWILNLSMHFRDKSKREKFFVTYRETPILWRRVTISLDYRNAPDGSLELDLLHTKSQRDKSCKIYEAIRESLQDIQFYPSVTNLKLQTTDGRLHVHVVEDVNEIIQYPTVRQVQHLGCRRIREKAIDFESHMSGFVYKVCVAGETLIKKEIPGPDTIDEFLYEINALNRLRSSRNIIRFYGVVVDDDDEHVKGLLISYADGGALIDVIYDNRQDIRRDSEPGLSWQVREKWARQIVQGLADIHEAGFVQGDFTLSNIVIDDDGDAKIIDINRRGCPVGWEPPEATPLIESNQRISMYIGVKSDLYQLGMVLWALAAQDDEPEAQGRPLQIGEDYLVPPWYRQIVDICLSEDPRLRLQASSLMSLFPEPTFDYDAAPPSISVDDGYSMQEYFVDGYRVNGHGRVRAVQPSHDWSYVNTGQTYASPTAGLSQEPLYYTRGRSPPSPLPSHYGRGESPHMGRGFSSWADAKNIAPSYSDIGADDMDEPKSATPTTSKDSATTPESLDQAGKAAQQKLNELQLTPVSHDFELEDQVDFDLTPVPEETKIVGAGGAAGFCIDERAERHELEDPIEMRPAVATPNTVKDVLVSEEKAFNKVDEDVAADGCETEETAGQTEPDQTGHTEPKHATDRKKNIPGEAEARPSTDADARQRETVSEPLPSVQVAAHDPHAAEAEAAPEVETKSAAELQGTLTSAPMLVGSFDERGPQEASGAVEETDTKLASLIGYNDISVAEAPELKGVGGAHMGKEDEKLRETTHLDDDFPTPSTEAALISTEAQK